MTLRLRTYNHVTLDESASMTEVVVHGSDIKLDSDVGDLLRLLQDTQGLSKGCISNLLENDGSEEDALLVVQPWHSTEELTVGLTNLPEEQLQKLEAALARARKIKDASKLVM